jgi:hypothetical protein
MVFFHIKVVLFEQVVSLKLNLIILDTTKKYKRKEANVQTCFHVFH